jgi:hypothetical protein
MKGRILSLMLALCCLLAAAQGASLFDQANKYEQAAKAGLSAELLNNLGDNYAADGQTGLAVLNYERALLLAPGNTELRATLTQLRKEKGLLREQSLHERLAAWLGADQWLLLSGASFVLLTLTVLAAGLLGRRRFPQACRLSAFFLTVTLLPLPLAWLRYQSWQDGVIIVEAAKLLISPFAEAETVASLKAGSVIRPLHKEHGQYALVRDADGHSGWLEQSSFQRIAAQP